MIYAVDVSEIVQELYEVLSKNQVPRASLDKILEELKKEIDIHTIIKK
jgi:hypothetical protein